MCNGICSTFEHASGKYYYCQGCTKYVEKKYLYKESNLRRNRCKCCHGLVRNKVRVYADRYLVTCMKPTV